MKLWRQKTSQKILILAVVISISGHLLMISAAGLIVPGDEAGGLQMFTVALKERVELPDDEERSEQKQPAESRTVERPSGRAYREDSVELGNRDGKYVPYLKEVKNRIDNKWAYPREAYERREAGMVIVKFSISRNGRLDACEVQESSGSASLDQGTLDTIRAASPFHPFPRDLDLSRLHVIASFKYEVEP